MRAWTVWDNAQAQISTAFGEIYQKGKGHYCVVNYMLYEADICIADAGTKVLRGNC